MILYICHEPPTMHPHDAHLSGSDVRREQDDRWSVVRAVRSPSLRASERQSHSTRATGRGGGAIVVMMVIIPMVAVCVYTAIYMWHPVSNICPMCTICKGPSSPCSTPCADLTWYPSPRWGMYACSMYACV